MGGRSLVVLASCRDYDPERVFRAVSASMAALGRLDIPRDKPVLLKPNLLMPADPAKGVTTHPAVFSAAARFFKETGGNVVFGDSPNGAFQPEATARRCGILAAAESLGIEWADFKTGQDVSHPKGVQNKRFHVARGVLAAGYLVNLPKLKTHGLTMMTGALKNIFGTIPGMRKAEFHIKHPDAEGFSRMIADLSGLVRSDLVIMDAIHAMEGNGPSGGGLVELGLLIVSSDPVAVDAVGCRLMGVDPMSVAHIRMAEQSGIGHASAADIEILGESVSGRAAKTFALPARQPGGNVPPFLWRFAKNIIVPKPFVDAGKCERCGQCVKACPAKPPALSMEGLPKYDYGRCIRCYCCQEICPHGAIGLKAPLLARVFERV